MRWLSYVGCSCVGCHTLVVNSLVVHALVVDSLVVDSLVVDSLVVDSLVVDSLVVVVVVSLVSICFLLHVPLTYHPSSSVFFFIKLFCSSFDRRHVGQQSLPNVHPLVNCEKI